MKDLMGMIPGVGKMVKDVDIDDNAFQGIEVIIRSMTPKERSQPKLLNHSRKMRIAEVGHNSSRSESTHQAV